MEGREIVFRVWDKQEKKWADSSVVQYAGLGTTGWVRDPTDRYIIVQYTGLKDKNGKEIYEGDILSVIPYMEPTPNYRKQVTWIEDRFGWNINIVDVYEIIGNIFENPGLLNK